MKLFSCEEREEGIATLYVVGAREGYRRDCAGLIGVASWVTWLLMDLAVGTEWDFAMDSVVCNSSIDDGAGAAGAGNSTFTWG